MSLYKRGNIYWSSLHMDGIRHLQTTGTGNLRKAELIEKRLKEELNLQRFQIVQPNPQMTVNEAAARFLAEGEAKQWHIDRLKPLLPYWGEIPIGRIHKSMAAEYRKRRHAEKQITDTTVNRDLEALRRILSWAVDRGFLIANPLSRLRLVTERRKPRIVISVADEALLVAAAAPHLRPIIITALDTGMRRGELLHQRWEHVDFDHQLLFVSRSKTATGEGREIPLTERVFSLLLAMRRNEGLVFTFHHHSIHQIKTAWKTAVRRAGIRYRRFHDCRHTANTRLMLAGVMPDVRKALLGHSMGEDVNATYVHVELPAKREAIRKLETWLDAQAKTQSQPGESSAPSPQEGR